MPERIEKDGMVAVRDGYCVEILQTPARPASSPEGMASVPVTRTYTIEQMWTILRITP